MEETFKHRGWSQVVHCDVCCGAAKLLGKLRILPSNEHESSSNEKLRKSVDINGR